MPPHLGVSTPNTDSPSIDGGLELRKRKDPLTFVGEAKSGYAAVTSSTQPVTYATPEVKPTPTSIPTQLDTAEIKQTPTPTPTKSPTPDIKTTPTAFAPIPSSKHGPVESLNTPEEKPPPVATTSKSDSPPPVTYSPQEKSTPAPSTSQHEVLAPVIGVASTSSSSLYVNEIIGIQKGSPSTTINLIGIHSEQTPQEKLPPSTTSVVQDPVPGGDVTATAEVKPPAITTPTSSPSSVLAGGQTAEEKGTSIVRPTPTSANDGSISVGAVDKPSSTPIETSEEKPLPVTPTPVNGGGTSVVAVEKSSGTPDRNFPGTAEEKPAPSPTPTASTAIVDATATVPQQISTPSLVPGPDSTIYVPSYSNPGITASVQTTEVNITPNPTSYFSAADTNSATPASGGVKSPGSTGTVVPLGASSVGSAVSGPSQPTPTPTPLGCVILAGLGVWDPSCYQNQPTEVSSISQAPVVVIASKTYTVSPTPSGQSTAAPYVVISSQTYLVSSTSLGGGEATYVVIASQTYTISAVSTPVPVVKTQSKAGSATGTGTDTSVAVYIPEVKSGASASTSLPRDGGKLTAISGSPSSSAFKITTGTAKTTGTGTITKAKATSSSSGKETLVIQGTTVGCAVGGWPIVVGVDRHYNSTSTSLASSSSVLVSTVTVTVTSTSVIGSAGAVKTASTSQAGEGRRGVKWLWGVWVGVLVGILMI